MSQTSIVWLRQDLRIDDNPALSYAAAKGPVIPLFIWSPADSGDWAPGGAAKWWLHHSLNSLSQDLAKLKIRLVIRRGEYLTTLQTILRETKAQALYFNRCYEPAMVKLEQQLPAILAKEKIALESFNSTLLFEPDVIKNSSDKPFRVFSPFWKHCQKQTEPVKPLPAIKEFIPAQIEDLASATLAELQLTPKLNWADGIAKAWQPGEAGAQKAFDRFIKAALAQYPTDRDQPAILGVSHLSPYLHFGEISINRIWHRLQFLATTADKQLQTSIEAFLRQLGWRDFAYHMLYHFPHTAEQPLRPEFSNFPWQKEVTNLRKWQQGRTGFPIVDAGMRELWQTGWMHNRVRMIVGSFLVKDLLLPWQLGAQWFWDTLVDADLANNSFGWQWVAGCGADAAPYFRIFNPILQGEKFDKEGIYVRRWLPELQNLSTRWIHKPWQAPAAELKAAGIKLGKDYPYPIVDHHEARDLALEAFAAIKNQEKH